MKKQIKLEAWAFGNRVSYFMNGIVLYDGHKRVPEYDIIKEIECPDEPKKARVFLLEPDICAPYGLKFCVYGENIDGSEESFKVREILDGEVVVTREMLWEAWVNCTLDDGITHFRAFCKKLRLGEK